jgi:hypothetical protein
MDTQDTRVPEPEEGSGYLQVAEQPTGSFAAALVYGFAVAVLGGMLWAAIVVFGQVELGILAWAIGGAVGAVMIWAHKKGSSELALAAVFLSLLGLASGKILSYEFGTVPAVEEFFLQDPDAVGSLISIHLRNSGDYSAEVVEWLNTEDGEEDPPEKLADEVQKFWEEVEALKEGSDRSFIKDEVTIASRAALADVSVLDRYEVGAFDLLWIFLAVGTAWRLGKGGSEPIPQRARTRRPQTAGQLPKEDESDEGELR